MTANWSESEFFRSAPTRTNGETASHAHSRHLCADELFLWHRQDNCQQETVVHRTSELRAQFQDKTVIVGVDRLDPIKGLPHKLIAFEIFLDRNPQWQGKVVLIQIGIVNPHISADVSYIPSAGVSVDAHLSLALQQSRRASTWSSIRNCRRTSIRCPYSHNTATDGLAEPNAKFQCCTQNRCIHAL
jgi:hypothetical protein